MKRLLISTRNALTSVLKDKILRGKLKPTWVSEFVKKKFSIFSTLWEIWKLPSKKPTVQITRSWKRKFLEN